MGIFDLFKKKQKKSNIDIFDNFSVNITSPNLTKHTTQIKQMITAEVRIKKAIADKHGLYPHEILVLDYAESYYTNSNSFQSFWWNKYGVSSVQGILSSLTIRGFLQEGDMQAVLEKQTTAVLKDVLSSFGCSVTGKKAELVLRALSEVSMDELNKLFPIRTYKLTELGEIALSENAYVPYIHRHRIEDLSIWSLNRLVYSEPHMPYTDKIWGYLIERSKKHLFENNYGHYRNCRYTMSQFLKEEGKVKGALNMLAEVVFLDVNGATNDFNMGHLEMYAKHFFPYKNSLATTAPGIINEIVDYQNILGYSDDELKAELLEYMNSFSFPLRLFTAHECVLIIFMERDKDTKGLTKLYAEAKNAFVKKHPAIKV